MDSKPHIVSGATTQQYKRGPDMSRGEIRVLHVDDEAPMRRTTARILEREGENLSVVSEGSPDAALERLEDERIDCIVSDYRMQDMDGIEFLKAVREQYGDIPFIIYTGKGSEDVASEAISEGVSDYLQKRGGDEFGVLAKQISNIVERDRAIKRFQSFLESAPDAIVIVDANGEINQVNSQAVDLFGYESEELLGKEVEQLMPPRYRDKHREYRDDFFDSPETRPMGADLDIFALRADGTEFPVDISISPISIDDRIEVMAAIRDISTQKWHEEQLREEQSLTKSIFSALPNVFYATSPDGSLIRWNDRLEELTGYTEDELEGMQLSELVLESDRARIEAEMEAILEEGQTMKTDTELRTKTGEMKPFELTGGALEDPDGDILGITGAWRDISERVELRRELTARLERITDGFVTLDHDWRFTYMNGTAEEILSVDEPEVLGESVWDVIRDLEGSEIGSALREAAESNESTAVEAFFEPLSRWFEVRIFPSQTGLSIYFRDVTDRRERQRRYEAVFDQTYQWTGLLEPDGTVIEANQTVLDFGGLNREDVVGKPMWEASLFQIDEETVDRTKRAVDQAAEGEFVRSEMKIQGKDRDAIIDFSITPVYNEAGEVTLLVPEGRDITELKEKQRELERQNKRLDEFASVVSHDLRNPLTVARTNLTLARDDRDDEYLAEVSAALDRMNDLVDELLSLAQKGMVVSEKQSVSLERAAEDAWQTVQTDNASLEIDSDITVQADPDRLRVLFENIYRNAVEHAGSDPHISVGEIENGFYVADDGSGIPQEKQDEVFEAGFTTEDDGTGFGLAIVRNIVEAHGWEIGVTDSSEGGARFEIHFENE